MLLKQSALYVLARGVPGLVNFLAIALYTRLLSPEEYGHYALVIAGVGFANAVLFQWIRLGLLRFLPTYQEREKAFLSTIVAGFAGVVIVTAILGGTALVFLANIMVRKLVFLGIILLWVQAWFEINLELARSQLSPQRYGFMTFTKAMVALFWGVLLAYLGLGALGLILGLIIGMLVSVFWQIRRVWKGVKLRASDRAMFNQLMIYGFPLTATFALGFIVSSSDRFLLGWLIGPDASGLYAVGYDLAQRSLGMLMLIINLAAYPLAVRALEQKGLKAAHYRLSQNAVALFTVAFPAAAGLALLAPNITEVFLGKSFREAAGGLIPWIAFGVLLSGIKAYYFDLSFQLGRYTVGQIWVVLIAAIFNFGLNLFLIPRFALMGAAYATVVSYAIGLLMSWVIGMRIFPLPFPTIDFLKIIVATMGMVMVLWLILSYHGAVALAWQVLLGGAIYVSLLIGFDVGSSRHKILNIFCLKK